tara:strand:- start:646 stop:867 length:222 start_codon:yes stop_codon:yes gene_type:complete
MIARKFKSLPANLNKIDTLFFLNNVTQSFGNFNHLHLKGEQSILTFGKSTNKNKETRKKIIEYFYKNLYKSKL